MDHSHITKMERFGNAMGYIPIVGSFAGAIKAVVYYNRVKKLDAASKTDQQKMGDTAEKTSTKSIERFRYHDAYESKYIDLHTAEKHYFKKIIGNSLLQMIPILGGLFAQEERDNLHNLSNARSQIGKEDVLVEKMLDKHNLPSLSLEPKEKREFLSRVITALDNVSNKIRAHIPGVFDLGGHKHDSQTIPTRIYNECVAAYEANPNASSADLVKEKLDSFVKELKDILTENKGKSELKKPQYYASQNFALQLEGLIKSEFR